MTKRDDRVISVQRIPVNAGPIQPAAPGRNLPQGQDRAPTRDAMPGLSSGVGSNRVPVSEGGQLQYRQWQGDGTWSPWMRLAEADVELRIVPLPAPKRAPYLPGT